MRLDILDDVSLDDSLSGSKRVRALKRRVLGDPRKAPRRIIGVLVFFLILLLIVGLLHLATTTAETSGSSLWLVQLLTDVVGTLWFAIPLAIYFYYKMLGRRRSRYAGKAAQKTGWLKESILALSDAVRSTDHTNRIIITTDDTFDTIRGGVDAALDGEPHPLQSVDYYGRGEESEEPTDKERPELPAVEPENDWLETEDPDVNPRDVDRENTPHTTDDPENLTWWESISQSIRNAGRTAADVFFTGLEVGWKGIVGLFLVVTWPFRAIKGILSGQPAEADSETGDETAESEEVVPWRVRFSEEFKHFLLDFSAGYRSDDIRWRFILPAATTMVTLLLAFRLWVHPVAYFVFAAFSLLVGLGVFWFTKRLRSRRLESYRSSTGGEHWDDVAGLVKTVETQDVTAYVGFMAGRTFASYDREEFVDEFSLRLWQHTHGERVSPSILEQYARNLGMMKPNLTGHRENIEIPTIQRRIKRVVEETEDRVVEKAELAFRVIEPADDTIKFERSLGHDPRLVAAEYRWLVEEGGVLCEMDVSIPNTRGDDTELTLVYPSEKTRLPDVQKVHSRLSDRFHGLQGEPFYRLPEVNPQSHLDPFQATATAWEEMPESGPKGHKTVSN